MNFMRTMFVAATVAATPLATITAEPAKNEPLPIVKIVETLEQGGYGPFTEFSYDDGRWEVEVYRDDASIELTVDPLSGKILAEHRDDSEPRPPQEALPLSKILHLLEKAGYANIDDASFERRYWEFETLHDDGEHEIHVDPKSGEVISDRLDD